MRWHTFLFLFLLRFVALHSQQLKITKGETFISQSPSEDLWIGNDSSGIYLINPVSVHSNTCTLYRFDVHNGNRISLKTIEFTSEATSEIVSAKLLGPKIILFVKEENKSSKVQLYRREFYASNGMETGKQMLADEFETGFETLVMREYKIIYSPDNSLRLLIREEITDSRQQIMYAKVTAVKDDKVIWEQSLNRSSEDQVPYGYNFVLTNDGYFCYLFVNDERHGIQIIHNKYSDNHSAIISSPGITIGNPALDIFNNALLCSGEVHEGERKYKLFLDSAVKMGFFIMKIDPADASVKWKSHDYFNPDLIRKLTYRDRSRFYKFEGVKSAYYSNKFFMHYKTFFINGAYYLVKYHGYDMTDEHGAALGDHDIIILKHEENKLSWMKIIPKKNHSAAKSGMAYICGDDLSLLYFDRTANLENFPDVENYDPKKYKEVKRKKSTLVQTTIGGDGKISRKKINSEKSWQLPADFQNTTISSGKGIILNNVIEHRRNLVLLKSE
jgi:hypothetical protein